MHCLGTTMVFEPQTWAAGLSAIAAAALLAEAAAMVAGFRRPGGRSLWILLPAAAVGGVIAAWIWGAWAGAATPLSRPLFGPPMPWAPRAALLAALPALAATCILAGAATIDRLAAALRGGATIRALFLTMVRSLLLVGLVGLTAVWVGRGAVVAIGVAAAGWALRAYSRTTSPVGRKTKAFLLGLRLAVVALLVAWALRPALEYHRMEEKPTVVMVCADTSASMQRRDAGGSGAGSQPGDSPEPVSRIEAVRKVLGLHRPALAELVGKADLELVPIAGSAAPAESFDAKAGWPLLALAEAGGAATALGDAVAEAAEFYAGQQRKVSAIVLISDGCNNTSDTLDPAKLAGLMASRGVPIHAVAVGSDRVTSTTRTITVRDLSAPEEVEAFNRLPITAGIEVIGLAGRRVTVTCTFGQEEIGSETFTANGAQVLHPVRFVHVPLKPGFHRVTVAAKIVGQAPPELAGRPTANRLVHVVDREMRVLYVEGKFRYEAKYIAQALVAARRFSVDRRVLLQPLADRQPPPLSEELDDWLAYHAILFGDVAASHFTARQLEIIRDLVSKYGKGFCMIGGSSSFGRGGWAGTPVADVLPIDLAASAWQIEEPVKAVATREGREDDVMRIGEAGADVAADWAALEELPGANKLAGLKPAATVLAESTQGAPLIVTQPYGKGRSMAIAFDTTWRWVLTKKNTADSQRRFWRQVALYLAAPKGTVWIVTDKTSYDIARLKRGSEVIKISAGVEDPRGRPLLDTPVQVKLVDPAGKEFPVTLKVADKIRTGQLPPPTAPGTYMLRIAARVENKPLSAEHHFDVLQRDLESLEVLANHDLLKRMASLSNGRFVTLDGFGDLVKELKITTKPEKRDTVTHMKLSADLRWPIVAALILLLCVEWAVRKRKGLV